MNSARVGLMIFGAIASATASAQTTPSQSPPSQFPPSQSPTFQSLPSQSTTSQSTTSTPPAVLSPSGPGPRSEAPREGIVDAAMLESGANSFTEGQASGRFEAAGFTAIQGLNKDEAGFWRGRGMRNGATTDLAMDFRGRIAVGPAAAALPTATSRATSPTDRTFAPSTGTVTPTR